MAMLAVSAALLVLTLIGQLFNVVSLTYRFSVDSEFTISAVWSAGLLVAAGGLMVLEGLVQRRAGSRDWRSWAALGAVLVLLGVDDLFVLHELFILPLRAALDLGGIVHYAWVLPGLVFVAVLAVVFRGFVRSLPRSIRRLLLLAVGLFLTGVRLRDARRPLRVSQRRGQALRPAQRARGDARARGPVRARLRDAPRRGGHGSHAAPRALSRRVTDATRAAR